MCGSRSTIADNRENFRVLYRQKPIKYDSSSLRLSSTGSDLVDFFNPHVVCMRTDGERQDEKFFIARFTLSLSHTSYPPGASERCCTFFCAQRHLKKTMRRSRQQQQQQFDFFVSSLFLRPFSSSLAVIDTFSP